MTSDIRTFLLRILDRPYYPARGILAVLFVSFARLAGEDLLGAGARQHDVWIAFDYAGWYAALFFGTSAILGRAAGRDWRQGSNLASYGLLLVTLPPLIDFFAHQPGRFVYRYLYDFSWLLIAPHFPVGEVVTIWLGIVSTGLFAWLLSGRLSTGLLAAIGQYLLLQWLGYVLPATGRHLQLWRDMPPDVPAINRDVFVSETLSAMLLYGWLNRERLTRGLRRWPHATPWFLTVFIGAGIWGTANAKTVVYAVVVLALHFCAVLLNDYYDRAEDAGSRRPTTRAEDVPWLLFLSSLLATSVAVDDGRIGTLLALYIIGTTAYHHHSLRLKQVCTINYKTEGLVGGLAFATGLLTVVPPPLTPVQFLSVFLAYGGFALVSMFKDFKDIDTDARHGIRTIYVMALRRGHSIARTHSVVRLIVLACLLGGTVLLALYTAIHTVWILALAVLSVVTWRLLGIGHPEQAVRYGLLAVNGWLLAAASALWFV